MFHWLKKHVAKQYNINKSMKTLFIYIYIYKLSRRILIVKLGNEAGQRKGGEGLTSFLHLQRTLITINLK